MVYVTLRCNIEPMPAYQIASKLRIGRAIDYRFRAPIDPVRSLINITRAASLRQRQLLLRRHRGLGHNNKFCWFFQL